MCFITSVGSFAPECKGALKLIEMFEQGPLLLNQWKVPDADHFEGSYCRLERLTSVHLDDLYEARIVEDGSTRYKYLFSIPPLGRVEFDSYMEGLMNSTTFVTYAVIDKKTNKAGGFQSFMNINPTHGTIEIGGILWGPSISRTWVTTEAFYLFTKHIFDDLHYRRYEWKCNNDNAASRNAALRFGFQFEGIFRQHLIQHGWNRDTAYFSMLDSEWPLNKQVLELWLRSDNFDENGVQQRDLKTIRNSLVVNE